MGSKEQNHMKNNPICENCFNERFGSVIFEFCSTQYVEEYIKGR